MKKTIRVMLISFCILALAACGDKNAVTSISSQEESFSSYATEESVDSVEETSDVEQSLYNVDLFNIIDEPARQTLNALYDNNAIDAYINNRFENAVTSAELTDIANEYVALWKSEMDHAISQFTSSLSEDKLTAFNQGQASWKQSIDDNLRFHSQCLLSDGFASELAYKIPVYTASLYKKRAFEIKYLDYLVNGESFNPALSFTSDGENTDYNELLSGYSDFNNAVKENRFQESYENTNLAFYSAINSDKSYEWSSMLIEANGRYQRHKENSPIYFTNSTVDINGDGTNELILSFSDGTLLAVFTMRDGQAVLLDAYWPRYKGAISDNKLYAFSSGGVDNYSYKTEQLSESGNLNTIESVGYTNGEYTHLKNDEQKSITKAEFEEIVAGYQTVIGSAWD